MILGILKRIYKSIALLPVVIALSFIIVTVLLNQLHIDYSQATGLKWMVIEDAKDSQTIFSFIIGGIFTLTIFSYTMVMNVLNRNINNYSPRLIPLILAERHHQLILGFTSGTIIYAMGMSLSLNNVNNGYFPAIAAGLGIVFSGFCVLLFIYFIHSVSQSIHINYILHEVYKKAVRELEFEENRTRFFSREDIPELPHEILYSNRAGYLHKLDYTRLHKFCRNKELDLHIVPMVGAFLNQEETLARTSRKLNDEERTELLQLIMLDHTVCGDLFASSIKHLVEVAVKASSPAINDPGTSLGVVDYMTQLLIKDSRLRIIIALALQMCSIGYTSARRRPGIFFTTHIWRCASI